MRQQLKDKERQSRSEEEDEEDEGEEKKDCGGEKGGDVEDGEQEKAADGGVEQKTSSPESMTDSTDGGAAEMSGGDAAASPSSSDADHKDDATEDETPAAAAQPQSSFKPVPIVKGQAPVKSLGEIVWAKYFEHPWWPSAIPTGANGEPIEKGDRTLVMFLDNMKTGWISNDKIVPFEDGLEEWAKHQTSEAFQQALKTALQASFVGGVIPKELIEEPEPRPEVKPDVKPEVKPTGDGSGVPSPALAAAGSSSSSSSSSSEEEEEEEEEEDDIVQDASDIESEDEFEDDVRDVIDFKSMMSAAVAEDAVEGGAAATLSLPPLSLPQGEGDAKLTTNFDLPRELLATTVSDAQDILSRNPLGKRVAIYWAGDQAWYKARVIDHRPQDGKFALLYDDGEKKWTELRRKIFVFEESMMSAAIERMSRSEVRGCVGATEGRGPVWEGKTSLLREARDSDVRLFVLYGKTNRREGIKPPARADYHDFRTMTSQMGSAASGGMPNFSPRYYRYLKQGVERSTENIAAEASRAASRNNTNGSAGALAKTDADFAATQRASAQNPDGDGASRAARAKKRGKKRRRGASARQSPKKPRTGTLVRLREEYYQVVGKRPMGRYQNDEEWLRAMMEAARAGKPGTFRERKAAGLSTAPRGFGSPPTRSGGGGESLSESDSGSDSDDAEAEAAAGLADEGWLKSGSEWIGRGVCRTFFGHVSTGRVVYWIPANDEGDEALWKVRHDDGDMEDLDEEELKAAHKDYLEQEANGPPPRRGGAGAAANGGSPFRRGTVAATLPNAEERARLKALYKQVLGKHPQGRYQNDLPWLRSAIKAAGGDHTEGAGCEAPKKREPAAEQKTQPGEAMVALRGEERKEEEQEQEQQESREQDQEQDQEEEQGQEQEQEQEQEQDGEDGQAAQGEQEEAGGAGALTQEELEEQWPVLLGAQAAVCGHAMTHVTFDSL